jgi:hypothetical protein
MKKITASLLLLGFAKTKPVFIPDFVNEDVPIKYSNYFSGQYKVNEKANIAQQGDTFYIYDEF